MRHALRIVAASLIGALTLGSAFQAEGQATVQRAVDPDNEPQYITPAGLHYLDALDPEVSALRGYAPAREPSVILAELESLELRPYPGESADARAKMHYTREKYIFHFTRANLITELFRAGYDGAETDRLLLDQVESIGYVYQVYINFLLPSTGRQLNEVIWNHPKSDAANLAKYKLMYLNLLQPEFKVHPSEMERIAAVEATLPHGEEQAGLVMRWAMDGWSEEEKQPWHDWMLEHLPPDSIGVRKVLLEREKIGNPVRVAGVATDGSFVDTEKLKGQVTILYFWGMWCGPCRGSTPDLKELVERRDLRVIGIYCERVSGGTGPADAAHRQ